MHHKEMKLSTFEMNYKHKSENMGMDEWVILDCIIGHIKCYMIERSSLSALD